MSAPVLIYPENSGLTALGRNGWMKAAGLSVLGVHGLTAPALRLEPITSKGYAGRCCIYLPETSVSALIGILLSESAIARNGGGR